MDIKKFLAKSTGFPVTEYRPFFYESINELFIILKDYVKELYKIDGNLISHINFNMLNAIDVFSETIKYKNTTTIVIGASSDVLLDWINCNVNDTNKDHYAFDSKMIITKVVCQKLLANSRFHEASMISELMYSVANGHRQYEKKRNFFL